MARTQGLSKELPHSSKRKAAQPAQPPKPAKKPKTSSDETLPASNSGAKTDSGPRTAAGSAPATVPLSAAHVSVLADLKTKYDILPALVLSSSKIQKRVAYLLRHLRKDDGDPRPPVALLHARPHEVCKMLTIAECLKRNLAAEAEAGAGGQWFQYNMLYAVPLRARKAEEVVDETVFPGKGADAASEGSDDDDDDDFEVMESRFERAVVPPPSTRVAMSLSIFLSAVPVPELKAREGVSVQLRERRD